MPHGKHGILRFECNKYVARQLISFIISPTLNLKSVQVDASNLFKWMHQHTHTQNEKQKVFCFLFFSIFFCG